MTIPWLTTLAMIPLVGALVIAALPKGRDLIAKKIAFGTSVLTLVISLVIARGFKRDGSMQFEESYAWIPAFGIRFALGVDGISLILILLATILVPIVILASWNEAEGGRFNTKTFFALVLALETFMIGVFAATDVFLFYVLF
jgi:NADH-quinone oxidoreductase subunit M